MTKKQKTTPIHIAVRLIEQTILRPLPTLIGCFLATLFSLLLYMVAFIFSYSVNDISVVIQFYIIGYVIGCIYEYVTLLIRHSTS